MAKDFVYAKTFTGVFANPNIVCRLREPATLAFLAKEFGDATESRKPKAGG